MTSRLTRSLLAILFACSAWSGAAKAGDPWQFWPELTWYVQLNPLLRLYLDDSYTVQGDTDAQSLDLTAAIDISVKPIARKSIQSLDWQRNRFFWIRIGYDHNGSGSNDTVDTLENRGILALNATAPLPKAVCLNGRVEVDFRWIEGDYSTRYRFRLEVNREFIVLGRSIVPYFNVESFYDSRYDAWSRTLYQGGSEFTVNRDFRYEIYLARQDTRLPDRSNVNALGVIAKFYY